MNGKTPNPRTVRLLQLGFLGFLWLGGLGLIVWILSLIRLSLELEDIPSASIGISLVAIPVFLLLLGLATYVFIGLIFDDSGDPEGGDGHEG